MQAHQDKQSQTLEGSWYAHMLQDVANTSSWWSPNFATEADAALCHGLLQIALHGAVRRPFPGDVPPKFTGVTPRTERKGGGVFEKLREIDLSQWAGRYTSLQVVSPGRWRGLCPLHAEKTPSFHVFSNPWRFKCFGCQRGGDIAKLAFELEEANKR